MQKLPLPHEIEWLPPISGRTPPPPLDARTLARVKEEFGGETPGLMKRFAGCPWAVRAMMRFRFPHFAHIKPRLGDLILLVVSQDSSCRFCYGNARAYLRLTGLSEAQIRLLETDLQQSDLPEQYRLALDFARLLARASPRPGRAEASALSSAGMDQRAIAEIATYAAYCVFATRLATLVAVAPDFENMADRWFSPLLRVALLLQERSKRKQVPPEPLPAEALDGPIGKLFSRLDGLPMAAVLYRALSEGIASEILPRRTKLLLLAVIGRALQCPTCESGCRTMLSGEGVLDGEVDDVLKRLHTPNLSPIEARLVPLARETARYEPAAIQRRMRELAGEIRDEELLEFTAITALANALARLTVILDCP